MALINSGGKRKVQPFYIDQHEITVKQFAAFDPKYSEKPHTGDRICPNCPAMGIDWFKADQYCKWAEKRLPTETEWDLAAQGPEGNLWPWGNQFLPGHANLAGDEDGYPQASPVGSFPQGSSPYGVLDLIGNVWEWVSDDAGADAKDSKKVLRVLKGGSWLTSPQALAVSSRSVTDPALKKSTFGFRCSKSLA
jgi:formylglycine-generating enzyme required for sulfatase activity